MTDKNLSILAENYQNAIDKMNVPITWMNRVMMKIRTDKEELSVKTE